jgi:hypothetical protein
MEGQWGFIVGASYAYSTNQNKIGLSGLADVNVQIGFIFTD